MRTHFIFRLYLTHISYAKCLKSLLKQSVRVTPSLVKFSIDGRKQKFHRLLLSIKAVFNDKFGTRSLGV